MESITEDILRWSAGKIESLQNARLSEMVQRIYRDHPYYSDLMRAHGLLPSDIQSITDLDRFPVTTKADFVAEPDLFRLDSSGMSIEDQALTRIIYTTGSTTGVPAPVYVTANDHYDYMLRSWRRRDFIDIRQGDMIASLFPLTAYPMGAYGRSIAEASACGASLLEINPGRSVGKTSPHRSTDEAIDVVFANQPQILWGIPSYVLRFLTRAAERGLTLSRLRMVMVTGEGLSSQMRNQLGDAMAAVKAIDTQVVNRYGSTEQGSAMVECSPGAGFHELAPDSLFMEVLDPQTGRRCADGQEGELAFTHLNRSGTVLFRFAVGDRAVLSHETCPHCGRTGSARITSGPFRSGDIVKIKGTLVNLAAVSNRLASVPGIADFQIVVDRIAGRDSFHVRFAAHQENFTEFEHTSNLVRSLVQSGANLTPSIERVSKSDLFGGDQAGKFRRVMDLRKEKK